MTGTNFQEAQFVEAYLYGACLQNVLWKGAENLTWEQIQMVGEEKKQDWEGAQDAYRRLKNHFHQQGQYEDESKAYYREKLMAKHDAFERCFRRYNPYTEESPESLLRISFHNLWSKIKAFPRWFVLWFLYFFAGFGEKIWRTVAGAAGFVLLFGLLYFWGTNAGWGKLLYDVGETTQHVKGLLDCLYFSVVTFATLGFGDISPAMHSWAKIVAVTEVVMGYVFLGTLVTLIARKMMR